MPRPETAFISWVGLRGAVSILLAITPLLGGLENGRAIFNIAFIVVLVSLVVQGWTVGPLARRLGLIVPARLGPLDKVELELPGSAHHELLAYTRRRRQPGGARRAHPALGAAVAGACATAARCASRTWAGSPPATTSTSSCRTAIRACSTGCSPAAPRSIPRMRISSAPSPSIPARSAAELEAAYAPGLTEAEQKLTIGALVTARLGGHAEYADRVMLGPIELIVRDVDDKGKITGLGLSFEPTAPVARVPVFLSAGEIGDRICAFVRNWRKPTETQMAEAQADANRPRSRRRKRHDRELTLCTSAPVIFSCQRRSQSCIVIGAR